MSSGQWIVCGKRNFSVQKTFWHKASTSDFYEPPRRCLKNYILFHTHYFHFFVSSSKQTFLVHTSAKYFRAVFLSRKKWNQFIVQIVIYCEYMKLHNKKNVVSANRVNAWNYFFNTEKYGEDTKNTESRSKNSFFR